MAYPDPNYFDYCASAPPFEEALERYKEISAKYFANPSSSHLPGKNAKHALLNFKEEFCELLNFREGRLVLCSSGTEANNTIIEGHMNKNPDGRILMAENVHDSMWYATKRFENRVDILDIEKNGLIDQSRLKKALRHNISLVCVNHVCNETGAIQNIDQIGRICSVINARLLVDGVQATGHIPVELDRIQFDYYSFSAHKFGGPRSFGGLLISDDSFKPLLSGGNQEWGLRAGTENIAGLAASIVALEKSKVIMREETERLKDLKNILTGTLQKQLPGILINSHEPALPGFVSLSFSGFLGAEIVKAMSVNGFSVSTGSACHDNIVEPSRIILALGRNETEAKGTIRISMGRGNTTESVNNLSEAIISYIRSL
jgi:cysteine desulfurase